MKKHKYAEKSELVKELNRKLKDSPEVKRLTTWMYGDLNKKFSIYMEGFMEGYEYTPFMVGVEGENNCISHCLINDKGTNKLFTTYENRTTLNKFFLEQVVPMYC